MKRTGLQNCVVVVCLLLALSVVLVPAARADCPLYRLPTSRFGVAVVAFGGITDYDTASLHLGWYSDWSCTTAPARPGGIEYVQTLTVVEGGWWAGPAGQDPELLRQLVDANPGAIWVIGNEPECPVAPGGGRMTPQQYATVYHELYTLIKGRDSSARIAIGGVVIPTPLRLEWLDQVLAYYAAQPGWGTMPVDIWTTHMQVLQEKRNSWGCGIPVGLSVDEGRLYTIEDNWSIPVFQQLILEFRTWLGAKGQNNKPLMITEYGVLMPYATDEDVNTYMTGTFDWLLGASDGSLGYPADDYHLVQRWLWYSLNDQPYNFDTKKGYNGGLFLYTDNTFPGTMTVFGQNFASYTNALLAGQTGTVCINGTVQREAASNHSLMATVTLLPVDCPQPDIRSVTTNAAGGFSLCNVLPGTYDVTVKGYNTLANRRNAQVLASGSSVNMGVLVPGDANNDNRITIADFSILTAAYRTASGDATYDLRADFNGDNNVNVLDFSLLATHYGAVGAQAW